MPGKRCIERAVRNDNDRKTRRNKYADVLENRAVNGVWKLQRRVYEVLRNEDGVGTVEVVLLILVATGLVLIFKDRITELVTNIFGKITSQAGKI